MSEFEKYATDGAYHWVQADPSPGNTRYNAPLAARYQALVGALKAPRGLFLDVGCGDGYLIYALRQAGVGRVMGLDDNRLGVHLAAEQLRARYEAQNLVLRGSTYALPYANATFDGITLADVIEHLQDPAHAVMEMARVLKPGGVLALSTPNWHPQRPLSRFHVQEFKPQELRDLLAPHFARVDIWGCWHARWLAAWKAGGWQRQGINTLARYGWNPLGRVTARVTLQHEQLIVLAWR
ncbi:MAG: class I SAM-dependent methyltransferase [Anaerolineae bacterium]|nr:class I SAM-dependent methyltransferase [Anaerolineae bacterium]